MKNAKMQSILLITLFLLVGWKTYNYFTDDFRLKHISHDMSHHPEWDVSPLSQEEQRELDNLFDQPFHYEGKGGQSYAFSSDDDRYIIKFVKFKHHRIHRPTNFLLKIPFTKKYQENRLARHERKLNSVFDGYKLAYDINKEESGLIAVHLNKTVTLNKKLKVKDKAGFRREIDLDSTIFIVQKKAQTTESLVSEDIKRGDIVTAKKRLKSVLDLFRHEYKKGVFDRDYCVMKNTGFIDEIPVHFDTGKLTRSERIRDPSFQKENLLQNVKKIRGWVKTLHPKYDEEFTQYLEETVDSYFS